jgi:tetratricopeptide (TPR) repeat protein
MLVLAQAGGSHAGAYAARPAECGVLEGFKAANVWERAKEPELRRYCDLLASGTAKLVGEATLAKDVLGIADQADALMSGRAAPKVLAGRAHLALGNAAGAQKALEEARARDDRALDDPVALLAWARANARIGNLDEAARAYRAALPRTSALSAQERSAASFEAGMAVMSRGTETVDDAVAMLRQARRDAQDAMQIASVVGLALALDRAGQRDEARAILAERIRGDVQPMLADERVVAALVDAGVPHEADALRAVALEVTSAPLAREAWRAFLAGGGGKGPWAEHARARSAATGGGNGAAAKPPPGGRAR